MGCDLLSCKALCGRNVHSRDFLAMDLLQCCRAVQGFYTALVRGLLVQRCTRAPPDAEASAINIANDPWESFGTRRLILTLVCPLLTCQSVAVTDGVAVQTSPFARRGIPSDNMTSISIFQVYQQTSHLQAADTDSTWSLDASQPWPQWSQPILCLPGKPNYLAAHVTQQM